MIIQIDIVYYFF